MTQTDIQPQNFRAKLQTELIERCRRNPRYSLRSFAKSLGIPSSALTEMLNGKRSITNKSIEKLSLAMGLGLEEIQFYLSASKKKTKDTTPAQDQFYRVITLDQYALISEWYYYAIIELIKVKDFQSNHQWIAKSLGITKNQTNIAIERLTRLGLIELIDGELKDTSAGFSTNIAGNLTSTGSKQLQKQILEQSAEALMTLPTSVRNHTSMTMAIDPALLPEAIKRIAQFRRELCEYLESQGNPKEVYQLSLSLFPVTQIEKNKIEGESHEKI